MPEDPGQREREIAVPGDPVGVANSGGRELHEHLARARVVQVKLGQDEGAVEFFDERGSDAH